MESAADPDLIAERFIRENTSVTRPPHVPEIALHLATEAHDLWLKTEEELGAIGLPPPFWAFAWAGGQGLARYILDHPECVADKTVLDFATGSGIVAIAALKAGAHQVLAVDTDKWALSACKLNATLNHLTMETTSRELVGLDEGWDVVLAGDVFYDRAMTQAILPWFEALAARGATVFVGDPGRSYKPADHLEKLATYDVPVLTALEDSEVKRTSVYRFRATA